MSRGGARKLNTAFFWGLAAVVSLVLLSPNKAMAWDNHPEITYFSLQSYEGWQPAEFEPIEKVLPSLSVDSKPAPRSLAEFTSELNIHSDKVNWTWHPKVQPADQSVGGAPTNFDVLIFSVKEPDNGMDQNLNLSPDQKYMGGYTGLSSQGIRHMYYSACTLSAPLKSFHWPCHAMGFAPARAKLFFDLASQAKRAGHLFWAYRFLGWGMHYVQDMGQPYHASQFASFTLLPIWTLLTRGWNAFVAESTRIVSNFHLSFEDYVDFLVRPDSDSGLVMAFKVPDGNEGLKVAMEQDPKLGILKGVKLLAAASQDLAAPLARAEDKLIGTKLRAPGVNIAVTLRDTNGIPVIDYDKINSDPRLAGPRKVLLNEAYKALSNTGVATRWYYEKFRAIK